MKTFLAALFVLVADQISKWFVAGHMEICESIPVWPGVFHWTYIYNRGAAFGIFEDQKWLFLAIVAVLFAGYAWAWKKIPKEPWYFPIGVGFLLGGALGNAIDRARLPGVVDFFDFRIWPIFNVADIGICVGMACILFYFWRKDA